MLDAADDWMHVESVTVLNSSNQRPWLHTPNNRSVSQSALCERRVHLVLTARKEWLGCNDSWHDVAHPNIPAIVSSLWPEQGTLDFDFIREIAHVDHEYGGKHEDGPYEPQFSKWVLRRLSSAHIYDDYPRFADGEIAELQRCRAGPLAALDIGSGPISLLRWGALNGVWTITAIDPLLALYRMMLARHGLLTLPRIMPDEMICKRAEEVPISTIEGRFDVVYTSNALDHTQAPRDAASLIARALRPDGFAVIMVAKNEGTRQKWDQLHKFDIRLEDGAMVAVDQHGRVQTLAGDRPDSYGLPPLRVLRVLTDNEDSLNILAQPQPR